MGVIQNGILGGFSGKVGPVVGGKWKDIDYMRSYVIPSNPNTVGQQAVRTKFSALVAIARQLLDTLLQIYWDPFHSDMSGYNAWMSKNYALLDGSNDLTASSIMAKGTLEDMAITVATYNTVNGELSYEWDGTIFGNGLATDYAYTVVYDKSTDLILFSGIQGELRGDEAETVTVPSGLTATNLFVYLFFTRGTGSEIIVSDSHGLVCSAA
jgi:hypothetical protein